MGLLAVLLIVLAIATVCGLLFSHRHGGKGALIAGVAGAIALVGVPLVWLSSFFGVEQLVDGYVSEFADLTGLDEFLAKALTAALIVPVLLGLKWFFSFYQQDRLAGKAILSGLLVLYWGGLWLATRGQLLDPITGQARKCYVITDHEVRYRDVKYQGVDAETGGRCDPVTPELVPKLRVVEAKLATGRSIEPLPACGPRFFSVATGEPIIWYRKTEAGDLECFDTPGFHPATGEELLPVTPEVVRDWTALVARREAETKEAARREAERQAADARRREESRRLEEEAARKAAEAARLAEAEERERGRLAAMRALVAVPPRSGGQQRVGLAIRGARHDFLLDQVAAAHLEQELPKLATAAVEVLAMAFTPAFFDSGHFTQVMAGNSLPLKEAEAGALLDFVALGSTEANCEADPQLRGLLACGVTLRYRIFDREGSPFGAGELTSTGPGFDEDGAVKRGAELLVERQGQKLFERILGR